MRHILNSLRRIHLGYGILAITVVTILTVLVLGNTTSLISLVASSASSLGDYDAVIFLSPEGAEHITVGETARIDVRVNTGMPINAVGATLLYPPQMLEILGISKEYSFLDLWTEETSIDEESGEIRFSGGTLTSGGHIGLGTVLSLTVRAKETGKIELSFKEAQIFGHDGRGAAIESDMRSFAYDSEESSSDTGLPVERPVDQEIAADFNDDGKTSLADLSILAVQLMSTYNTRYDLDRDGMVNLKDVSILFTKMQ
ncbi:MAG: hypothetical protein WAZ27_03870 [Minisyncoccia bacterium]